MKGMPQLIVFVVGSRHPAISFANKLNLACTFMVLITLYFLIFQKICMNRLLRTEINSIIKYWYEQGTVNKLYLYG